MAELTRTKRRILREAVQENVDVIKGHPPTHHVVAKSPVTRSVRLFLFLTVPIAIFTTSYVVATMFGSRSVATVTSAPAPAPPAGGRVPVPAVEQPAFELVAPSLIDPAVFPVAVRKIVIDPGHGGTNLGTTGPYGLVEKEITLDIAHRLRELLEADAYHVVMTRTDDAQLSLQERAVIANQKLGDIFISIHVNWLVTRQVRGVETYYLGATDDPYLSALAANENQGSGYSLADLRGLIEEIYANARMGESQRLASGVQHSLYRSLVRKNPTLQDRGVKTAPFGVLTRTGMPAILVEVACLSNDEEARLLMTADYRQFIADSLYDGIHDYSNALSERGLTGS